MNSFWSRLYDRFKDRRYGFLFLVAFLGVIVGAALFFLLCQLIDASEHRDEIVRVLPILGLLPVAWLFVAIRRSLARRRERIKFPPLSSDELRVARSKLRKTGDRKRV